jgi:hypothetical protein
MPHVTLEYVIMIPVLVLQLFLFPAVAGILMNNWVVQRRTVALEEAGSNIGSTIQQVYFEANQATVPACAMTYQLALPPFIDGYYYTVTAVLQPYGGTSNASQLLTITLTLPSTAIKAASQVTLGANASWNSTTIFLSNSASTSIYATKTQNGASTNIALGFGG